MSLDTDYKVVISGMPAVPLLHPEIALFSEPWVVSNQSLVSLPQMAERSWWDRNFCLQTTPKCLANMSTERLTKLEKRILGRQEQS